LNTRDLYSKQHSVIPPRVEKIFDERKQPWELFRKWKKVTLMTGERVKRGGKLGEARFGLSGNEEVLRVRRNSTKEGGDPVIWGVPREYPRTAVQV